MSDKEQLTKEQVIEILWEEVRAAGSQVKYAKRLGVSKQYLGDILHGRREPGKRVLGPLGIREVRYYERED